MSPVPTFGYTTGNPDNLVGGLPAAMTDVQGPLYDLRTYLNTVIKPLLDSMGLATFGAGDIKPTCQVVPPAPAGWLLCNGDNTVSRATYTALFAVIGTTYGAGIDGNTFAVPDLRGRMPIGADPTLVRLTASAALGNAAGVEKHPLAPEEVRKHAHNGLNGTEQFVTDRTTTTAQSGAGVTIPTGRNSATGDYGGDATHVVLAHNNMPPYQIVNWLIKT